jgi:hypothetical protein
VALYISRISGRKGNHNSKIAAGGGSGRAAGWGWGWCTPGVILVRSVALGALFLILVAAGFLVLDLYT